MINTRSWIGIFIFLLSFSVFAADIEISDAWIRPTTQGYENGIVGLTISTPSKIKIIGVNSPAYSATVIQKSHKIKGQNKMETVKSVSLSAGKTLVFGPDNIHLALSGNKNTLNSGEKIPVILTVQYENKTTKDITFLAQPVRIRAGAAPLPIASSNSQTKPKLVIEQPAQAMQLTAPAAAEPLPEEIAVSAEPVIAAPAPQPTPEAPSPAMPKFVSQPPPEAAPQPTPEKALSEATDSADISPVEDCTKYSKAMNACNQVGELDDIMKCRNITKSKLSCT